VERNERQNGDLQCSIHAKPPIGLAGDSLGHTARLPNLFKPGHNNALRQGLVMEVYNAAVSIQEKAK
jgi:hypothetical protein